MNGGNFRQGIVSFQYRQSLAQEFQSVVLQQSAANETSFRFLQPREKRNDFLSSDLQWIRGSVEVLVHRIPRDVSLVQVPANIVDRHVTFALLTGI